MGMNPCRSAAARRCLLEVSDSRVTLHVYHGIFCDWTPD